MEFVDANKQITGYAIDYMKAAAKSGFSRRNSCGRLGRFFSPVSMWANTMHRFLGFHYRRAEKVMDFSEPYFRVRQAVIVRKGFQSQESQGTVGKQVGSQISTTGTFAVKP